MLITDPIPKYENPRPGDNTGREVAEAYENLRVIREVMDRSTKHSTLSGFSGILAGVLAIIGTMLTGYVLQTGSTLDGFNNLVVTLAAIWFAVLGLAIATDFVLTKSRAVRVGKQVFSTLGVQMVRAAAPAFVMCLMVTL